MAALVKTTDTEKAWLRLAIASLLLAATWLVSARQQPSRLVAARDTDARRFQFEQVHMGVPFRILLYAHDEPSANRAAAAAYGRIAALDDRLSDYDPQSELSRLSRTAGSGRDVKLSPDLWAVLERSQQLARRTGGAFDVTVGPYVRLWRRARRQKEFPDQERLAEAGEAVGFQDLVLDRQAGTARLMRPGMRLDLGGIGMGYAADEAYKTLVRHGVRRALIDASGDVLAGDPPPGASGWKVAVAPAGETSAADRILLLARMAVTTSGDAYQYVELGGQRYSHIVDPRTGLGLTDQTSATVVAADCTTADSLATAVSVLGPQRGLELVESIDDAEAFIVRSVGGELETWQSAGFSALLAEPETHEPADEKDGRQD